jgi:hypothetical protein
MYIVTRRREIATETSGQPASPSVVYQTERDARLLTNYYLKREAEEIVDCFGLNAAYIVE